MASRRPAYLGPADPAGSFWYVDLDDIYLREIEGTCQLTSVAGASSAVPGEDSTAFSAQIEGT
jgi:hypothetical protein